MNANDIYLSVDGNVYIVTISNKAYSVNELFYKILCGIKTGMSVDDSIRRVSIDAGVDYDILFNKFSSFWRKTQQVGIKKSYIRYKHIVIKEKPVNKIATTLAFFYSKFVFWILLFTCIITNVVYYIIVYNDIHQGSSSLYTLETGIFVFLCYIFSLVIHEIGHASATASVGRRAKEIGFGFYMIFPVFYTDVTSVWNMGKRERILVNIGGVYFQLLVNAIIIGLILIFPQSEWIKALNSLVISNILVVIISMTPFFRNDGYWILSDYFEIPNLLKRSDNALRHFFYRSISENMNRQIVLILFGVSNNLFRIYVFVRLALNLYNELMKITSLMILSNLIGSIISIIISLIGMYWIFICYYNIFRYENQNRY